MALLLLTQKFSPIRINVLKKAFLISVALLMIIQKGMTVKRGDNLSRISRADDILQSNLKSSNHVRHHRHPDRQRKAILGPAKVLASKKFTGLYTGPYFDPGMPENITAQMGDTALITCNVNQIGKFEVMWVRIRDKHILAIDRETYISDDRFFILKPTNKNAWTLRIRYVQRRDAGLYECQVSTEPKLSHIFRLNVVEPKVTILGNGDVHANQGSKVVLKCKISGTLQKPAYIFWYHNSKRLLPDYTPSMATTVETKIQSKSAKSNEDSNVIVDMEDIKKSKKVSKRHSYNNLYKSDNNSIFYEASLILDNVKPNQSGNYTCGPSNSLSASVSLHIIQGETRAAMSDGASSGDEVSLKDSAIHVASSASSFTIKATASSFPSNIIKTLYSSVSLWNSSEIIQSYFFQTHLNSRSTFRLPLISSLFLVYYLTCRRSFDSF